MEAVGFGQKKSMPLVGKANAHSCAAIDTRCSY